MKVAIISDIHDNIWALEKVLTAIAEEKAEALLVCGDLCAPFSLKMVADGFSGPVHVVFGNNDGDQMLLTRMADRAANVTLHGLFGEISLDGGRVAITHYPEIGKHAAAGGEFQAVFYGHSHEVETIRRNGCLCVNPGEVMGRFGRSTYALYDTQTGIAEIREV